MTPMTHERGTNCNGGQEFSVDQWMIFEVAGTTTKETYVRSEVSCKCGSDVQVLIKALSMVGESTLFDSSRCFAVSMHVPGDPRSQNHVLLILQYIVGLTDHPVEGC